MQYSPPHQSGNDLVVIAILVSRVEALCFVSMLGSHGFMTHLDGSSHASVEINSLVLGGHRVRVAEADYEAASSLIREVGADKNWQFSEGLRRAVLRLIIVWAAVFVAPFTFTIFSSVESRSLLTVILPFASIFTLPVNPQGHGDFYLAAERD